MSLSTFIKMNEHAIIAEWETFARSCMPESAEISSLELRDSVHEVLQFIVADISSPQTERERSEKSKGWGEKSGEGKDSIGEMHGHERFKTGFNIVQMHAEFRALRASVLKLWTAEWIQSNNEWKSPADVIPDLMRFNEAIDQMVHESLMGYLQKRE